MRKTRPFITTVGGALVLVGILATATTSGAQQIIDWRADDGKRVASLETGGTRLEGSNAILWFPPSLTRTEAAALLKRIDPAVEALWQFVGVHDWQQVPKGKITYYLHDDDFPAHATGRSAVFVPMARVKDGRAPLMHEAAHEMLATKFLEPRLAEIETIDGRPLWLVEGLPSYITSVVAGRLGITEVGPFGTPPLSGIDAQCRDRARTPDGAEMLPFVGARALPIVLLTADRPKFAPTFYDCAFSFTKHLVERVGIDAVIGLYGLTPVDAVARLDVIAGRPLPVVVSEWRARIGLQ